MDGGNERVVVISSILHYCATAGVMHICLTQAASRPDCIRLLLYMFCYFADKLCSDLDVLHSWTVLI